MSNPGSRERLQLGVLENLASKLQHIHGLVERFANDTHNPDQWSTPIRRSFARLKLETSGAGFDSMAQLCGSMDAVAKRTGGRQLKIRLLRETVASLRSQIETETRIVRMAALREEQLEERRKEEQEKKA